MKLLRVIAFIIGGLVVLLAIVVTLALVPGIQTWAVKKALANQTGNVTLEVNRVAVGFSSAEISGLRAVQDGAIITADEISARYSAWDYISHKKINVDMASAKGLVVDLRHAKPSAAATPQPATAKSTPFDGLLNSAKLPVAIRIAQFSLDGRALLPMDRTANFSLQGGDIEAGKDGKVSWKIDYIDAGKTVAMTSAQNSGTVTFHVTSDLRIDSLALETTAAGHGASLPDGSVRVEMKATQPAPGGNESYELKVALVRGEKTVPLVSSHIDYATATRTLAGTWEVTAGSADLTAMLTGFGLPDITAKGAGKFNFAPATNTLRTSGSLQAQLSALQKMSPALTDVGRVQLQTDFDANVIGDVAKLNRFQLVVTDANQRKLADISALQPITFNTTNKKITLADPKAQLARIAVQNLPLAWAQSFAQPMTIAGGDVSLVIAVTANEDGSRVTVSSVEPVSFRSVTIRNGTVTMVDQAALSFQPHVEYSASVITADLSAIKLSLPAGDSIDGSVTAKITNADSAKPITAFTAQLQGKLAAALKPYLPVDVGAVSFATSAEGNTDGQTLHLAKANAKVDRSTGGNLVTLEVSQSVDVNLATEAFVLAKPDSPVARVRLGEIPLSWGETFVPKSKLAGSVAGGAFDLSVRSLDDVSIKSAEPFVLRGISATIDQQVLAQNLDLSANFTARMRGQVITYDVGSIEVKQGAASLAKIVVAGEATMNEPKDVAANGMMKSVSAKGSFDADLTNVGKQPAAASLAVLSKGNVTMTFDATSGKTILAKGSFKLNNLVAKENNQSLGSLEASIDANVPREGSGSVKLPVVLVADNRRSDILVEGKVTRSPSGNSFEGKLASDQIFVDDFKALAALAPSAPTAPATPDKKSPTPPKTATPAASTAKDAVAFWHGVSGKFETDLKKIQVGKEYLISGIKGRFAVTDAKVGIDTLEGNFDDTPFKVVGGLTFAAAQAKPYTLDATANVTNFDTKKFLLASNPNEKPVIESKVTIAAKLAGNAANLAELSQVARGQFDVAGTAGVFRPLDKNSKEGKTAGAASGLLGLAGALTGSQNTAALGELLGRLEEMAFDKFTMHLERGTDLAIKITTLDFISSDTHLSGTGTITSKVNVPPTEWPLRLDLQLAGKDNMARLLNEVHVLQNKKDSQGYYLMTEPMIIDGTVGKPDSSQIKGILRDQAAKAAVSGLGRLLK